ncbi:MAG TPA: TIGR04348 family glycosyltransferase, partial [Planctomycetota bacterium]|nr:TIGR04348 family glycosyltransferase [Planctomycetota bacterium]
MSWARNVLLVDPGAEGRAGGNRVTALRWAMILRRLGHRPRRAARFDGRPADVLVALHAVRSADSIDAFRARFPGGGVVVALTGTDLHDAAGRDRLERSLALADAVVVLHEGALPLLPDAARGKARVIVQSVELPREPPPPPSGFQVCVLANLRAVKDPLLGARAAMLLPASSRARVVL